MGSEVYQMASLQFGCWSLMSRSGAALTIPKGTVRVLSQFRSSGFSTGSFARSSVVPFQELRVIRSGLNSNHVTLQTNRSPPSFTAELHVSLDGDIRHLWRCRIPYQTICMITDGSISIKVVYPKQSQHLSMPPKHQKHQPRRSLPTHPKHK